MSEEKPMTFGEQLVGLRYNPSGDDKVFKAKKLCADLADLLYYDYLDNKDEGGSIKYQPEMYLRVKDHAIGEILNAQMNVVKALTQKY